MRAPVGLHVDAPPDKVWGLVSDITKMGEHSPEVIEAEWIDRATGPKNSASSGTNRSMGVSSTAELWWLVVVVLLF